MKIFLIGMMGSGKTHWLRWLSKKGKTGGYDLDFLIESNEEKTIAEIFEQDGETYFRKAESKVLRWFGEKKSFVLACGGGTPCFNENMEWMNSHGITIWIDEPIETLVERLRPEKEKRPLIRHLSDGELEQYLVTKLLERRPFYERAAHHLAGKDISEATFSRIIKQYA